MIVDSFLCIANQHLPGFEKISVPEGTKVNSRGRVPIYRESPRESEGKIEDPERVRQPAVRPCQGRMV
jgi:hypothetical protein